MFWNVTSCVEENYRSFRLNVLHEGNDNRSILHKIKFMVFSVVISHIIQLTFVLFTPLCVKCG